jgi:MFS family permease
MEMTVFTELRMSCAAVSPRGWDASITARLVLAGMVIFTLLIGANLATPLYPLYQSRLGLTSMDITVAFAAYVLALVATLVLAGHWSDHIGRRAALLLAVLVGLTGGLVFATAGNLSGLSAGRALQGTAVALATGASSAALRELLPSRPEWASRFTLLASAGGVAAGPVIGGVLSLLPGPTSTPFVVHSVILSGLLVPLYVLKARPAVRPVSGTWPIRALAPRRPSVSPEARGAFWLAAAVGFLGFAVFGFCLSLAPGFFAGIVHVDSRPLIGVLAGLTLGSSALSQLLAVRGRYVVPVGLLVLAVSVALIAVAAAWTSPWLLALASMGAGLGQGISFRAAFNDVAGKTEPSLHAQVISAVYVITYLGSAVPVIALGFATTVWGLPVSVTVFVLLCAVCAIILAVASLLRQRTVVALNMLEHQGGFRVADHGVCGQVVQHPVPEIFRRGDGDMQQVIDRS